MSPGRLYDDVTDPVMARCEGCAQSLLMCEVCWDHDRRPCCGVCTHRHPHPTPDMVDR